MIKIIVAVLVFSLTFVNAAVSIDQAQRFSSSSNPTDSRADLITGSTELVLLDVEGTGFVSSIFLAAPFIDSKETVLLFYCNGEVHPSFSLKLLSDEFTGFDAVIGALSPNSRFLNLKIPFSLSLRITALNPHLRSAQKLYWNIKGVLGVPLEIGGIQLPSDARLKIYEMKRLVQPIKSASIFKTDRPGLLAMVDINFRSKNNNFLEGPLFGFFDGRREVLSSSIDEYLFSTLWFSENWSFQLQGYSSLLEMKQNSFRGFRIHLNDYLFWKDSFELVWQNGVVQSATEEG